MLAVSCRRRLRAVPQRAAPPALSRSSSTPPLPHAPTPSPTPPPRNPRKRTSRLVDQRRSDSASAVTMCCRASFQRPALIGSTCPLSARLLVIVCSSGGAAAAARSTSASANDAAIAAAASAVFAARFAAETGPNAALMRRFPARPPTPSLKALPRSVADMEGFVLVMKPPNNLNERRSSIFFIKLLN